MNKRDKQWFNEAVSSVIIKNNTMDTKYGPTGRIHPGDWFTKPADPDLQQDIDFLRLLLPHSYKIEWNEKGNGIHCVSPTGIDDGNGDKAFTEVFQKIKGYFKERFLEVYHSTCYNHVNFTVYLKNQQHMQEQKSTGTVTGRDYPLPETASTRQQADELQRQQNLGQGLQANYPHTPGQSFASTSTAQVEPNPIKPFMMIDINAVKNKQYTVDEIVDMFRSAGTMIHCKDKEMSFGEVLKALKGGQKCARTGWNGKGMFIYYVPGQVFPSVTDVAKQEFGTLTPYNEYIAIKNTNGTVSTWVPSINDCFATDWMIV